MNDLINKIEKELNFITKKIIFKNEKLNTIINLTTNFYENDLIKFAKTFNTLFNFQKHNDNCLNCYIINNDKTFEQALKVLNDKKLVETKAVTYFNKATANTSLTKCTFDHNYYIMRCYEYFIYIFDKKRKRCFMLIKKNKKVITMINILLLTPYLMYGELYAVHGGLVNKKNKNVLINNASLGGKTTFAILFASNDWDIITEETTYITKKGEILPYNIRNYFNIRVGTYLNFLDFFKKKNITIDTFINMKSKNSTELFDFGKEGQVSINFEKIGKFKNLDSSNITHCLKVSIAKDQIFKIERVSPIECVNSFLELSLAPTVLLFKDLLDFDDIDSSKRKHNLEAILNKTKSFKLISGLDYKDHFDEIIKVIN